MSPRDGEELPLGQAGGATQPDLASSGGSSRQSSPCPSTAPEPKRDYVDRFDWSTDDTIIFREQRATAVYLNTDGAVVIRQERAWDEDDDIYIVVQSANLGRLISSLVDLRKYLEAEVGRD